MWSEHFEAEERAARPAAMLAPVAAVVALGLGLAALAMEVVLSIDLTARELSARTGSVLPGLLALGLGFLGPYATVAAWRSAQRGGRPALAPGIAIGLAATVTGAIAIAWLLLVRSSIHPVPLLPF